MYIQSSMKTSSIWTTGIICATVLVVAVLGVITYTQNNPANEQTITVEGRAKAKIVPDQLEVSILLRELSDTSDTKAASTKLAERVNKLTTNLKQAGVPEDKLKTGRVSIAPYYEYWNEPTEKPKNQTAVEQTLTIKAIDTKEKPVTELASTITQSISQEQPGVQSFYYNYSLSNADAEAEKLRTQALENAREKANTTAKSLSAQVQKVKSIVDNNTPGTFFPAYARSADILPLGAKEVAGDSLVITGAEEQEVEYAVQAVFVIR
jgi:uncharacterized protein YggE